MKTLDEAVRLLKLCRRRQALKWDDAHADERDALEEQMACLCNGCCHECTTPIVLYWVWPELKDRVT